MQASNSQSTRAPVVPAAPVPTIRRRSLWPFKAVDSRRKTDNIAATAKGVIATTAMAFLAQRSSS